MTYIIDRTNMLTNNGVEQTSLLIKNNQVEFIRPALDNFKYMKMNMSRYLLTPGYVMPDFSLNSSLHFTQFKEIMIHKLMKKGCTAVLTVVSIQYEKELDSAVKNQRQLMINSPIDFYIGVKINLEKLTPSFIRSCKKLRIPVIFIEFNNEYELERKPWGWIRDAMFSSPITLIPYPAGDHLKLLNKWKIITKKHKMSSLNECPKEHAPLEKEMLMTIGIYPEKGEIRAGSEVDYNMYDLSELSLQVDEKTFLHYDSHNPVFTVHKGRLINVNSRIIFKPGYGEECFITIPSRFIIQHTSF
ncbi:hypothetical protein ABET51_07105 [Metabacillus fastidiosus]|uniref:hypothetical protein n=1 Tax=Metabacillus fastidiosus TaxID=1458 RepID=UPI002E22E536|nr:hypothetical protein [Metabacillus fastidiosus]